MFETGLDGRMAERPLASLREFGDFINRIKWRATREQASTVLADLIKAIDYQAYLAEQGDERSAAARWQNVNDFCDWIRKRAEDDGPDEAQGDGVPAVTAHDGAADAWVSKAGVSKAGVSKAAAATAGTEARAAHPAQASAARTVRPSGGPGRNTRGAPVSLVDIAQHVALITRLEGRESDGDAVRMSTIHAAKGLEYPHVFLIGVEEGLLPHAGRVDDDVAKGERGGDAAADAEKLQGERLEEERRLMYVATTRAKRSLTLTWCRQRKRARSLIECQPSRFITEMELDIDGSSNKPVSSEDAKKRLAALREMFRKD